MAPWLTSAFDKEMKIWPVIYSVLFVAILVASHEATWPHPQKPTNADWIFISISFFTLWGFCPLAVAYGFNRSRKEFLEKPTWTRHPLGWWTDTLQCIRISLVFSLATVLGAATGLSRADEQGKMIFLWHVSITLGLFLGEKTTYWIYRKKIIEPADPANLASLGG
jgi:hypothetical protein